MSTIRVVNIQHPDSVEPNVVLKTDGTAVFASGITISGSTNLTVSGTAEFASGTAANPEITFIDDNDTGIYSPAANKLGITANGSSKLVVTQSGVGVSTSSPGGPFEVQTGAGERIVFDSAGASQQPRIRLNRDSGADYNIQNALGVFEIQRNGGNLYRYASDNHQFFNVTGSNELLRIQSGGGISFNGDTAASNALGDYEEGTFTPTLRDATAYTYQDGDYTKIGDMVYFYIRIQASASSPSSNPWVIQGLPFASANDDVFGGAFRSFGRNVFSSTASDAVNFHIGKNSSEIVARLGSNGTSYVATQNTSFVSLNEQIILQGFYKPAGG